MAIDEAIFKCCAAGQVPPTLRIYQWEKPSISIGYMQKTIDLNLCAKEGVDVVRRITGGRAVVHGKDLTFSISMKESEIPKEHSSILKSHRWLMQPMIEAIRSLGIKADFGDPRKSLTTSNTVDCFSSIAACDIKSGSQKMVGSAQVRKYNALLEQGSIPYGKPDFDVESILKSSYYKNQENLCSLSFAILAEAIITLFSKYNDELVMGKLTNDELEIAEELAQTKYSNVEWNCR